MDLHDGRDAACAIPVARNTMRKTVTRPRPARKNRFWFIAPPLLSLETAPFAVLPTGPEYGEGCRGEHPPGMADISVGRGGQATTPSLRCRGSKPPVRPGRGTSCPAWQRRARGETGPSGAR